MVAIHLITRPLPARVALVGAILTCLTLATGAVAQITLPGINSQDGTLHVTADQTIDLALAPTGAWDSGLNGGDGVYDPDQWAVVFHYQNVIVDAGATLTFANHPANPPVIWLVEQDVVIEGVVSLNGYDYCTNCPERPGGPGGFAGGRGAIEDRGWGAGFGPGGGRSYSTSGSYGTVGYLNDVSSVYGNESIVPLIGGSGGAGDDDDTRLSGGGGGGAIFIAAQDSIRVGGAVRATGGDGDCSTFHRSGGGSGGAVKLVSDRILGSGGAYTLGGGCGGGFGRIRLEGNFVSNDLDVSEVMTSAPPAIPPQIFPTATDPVITILTLNQADVGDDPHADLDFPDQDVMLSGEGPVEVELETANVPTESVLQVWVVKTRGNRLDVEVPVVEARHLGGNKARSTWLAEFADVPSGTWVVQARAVLPEG